VGDGGGDWCDGVGDGGQIGGWVEWSGARQWWCVGGDERSRVLGRYRSDHAAGTQFI